MSLKCLELGLKYKLGKHDTKLKDLIDEVESCVSCNTQYDAELDAEKFFLGNVIRV